MVLPLRSDDGPAETDGPDSAGKQPGAFRTISEVAEELDVPQHVLRFWETRFVQVRPVKRAGGRRYYRPQDVDLLRGLRRLLYAKGYTIRGAQLLLREKGLRAVQAIGRGESEAAPAITETPERRALETVLDELHACRAALAELRDLPADA